MKVVELVKRYFYLKDLNKRKLFIDKLSKLPKQVSVKILKVILKNEKNSQLQQYLKERIQNILKTNTLADSKNTDKKKEITSVVELLEKKKIDEFSEEFKKLSTEDKLTTLQVLRQYILDGKVEASEEISDLLNFLIVKNTNSFVVATLIGLYRLFPKNRKAIRNIVKAFNNYDDERLRANCLEVLMKWKDNSLLSAVFAIDSDDERLKNVINDYLKMFDEPKNSEEKKKNADLTTKNVEKNEKKEEKEKVEKAGSNEEEPVLKSGDKRYYFNKKKTLIVVSATLIIMLVVSLGYIFFRDSSSSNEVAETSVEKVYKSRHKKIKFRSRNSAKEDRNFNIEKLKKYISQKDYFDAKVYLLDYLDSTDWKDLNEEILYYYLYLVTTSDEKISMLTTIKDKLENKEELSKIYNLFYWNFINDDGLTLEKLDKLYNQITNKGELVKKVYRKLKKLLENKKSKYYIERVKVKLKSVISNLYRYSKFTPYLSKDAFVNLRELMILKATVKKYNLQCIENFKKVEGDVYLKGIALFTNGDLKEGLIKLRIKFNIEREIFEEFKFDYSKTSDYKNLEGKNVEQLTQALKKEKEFLPKLAISIKILLKLLESKDEIMLQTYLMEYLAQWGRYLSPLYYERAYKIYKDINSKFLEGWKFIAVSDKFINDSKLLVIRQELDKILSSLDSEKIEKIKKLLNNIKEKFKQIPEVNILEFYVYLKKNKSKKLSIIKEVSSVIMTNLWLKELILTGELDQL